MTLRRLWCGDVPLETAFWSYAVFGGILVNILTSAGFLALISLEQPIAAAIVGYGLSLPYNGFATVGVWRAAARDDADPQKARLYLAVTLIGMAILSLT